MASIKYGLFVITLVLFSLFGGNVFAESDAISPEAAIEFAAGEQFASIGEGSLGQWNSYKSLARNKTAVGSAGRLPNDPRRASVGLPVAKQVSWVQIDLLRALDIDQGKQAVPLVVNVSDSELFQQGVAAIFNHRHAISIFSQIVTANPANADGYRGRAWVYLRRGKFDEAIADFNRVLELDPDYSDAYRGRGWALLLSGQIERAQSDFSVNIARARNPAESFYGRGLSYYFLGNLAAARSNFRASMRYTPARNDALTYTRTGEFLWDFSKAAPGKSEKRHGISPLNPDSAVRLDDWQKYRKIFPVLQARVRSNPNDAEAWFAIGVGYYRQHDDGGGRGLQKGLGAAKPFDRALALDPMAVDVLMARAMLRGTPSIGGNSSGAVADLTEVIQINPEEVEAFYQRALMLAVASESGSLVQAVDDCAKALSLAPDNPVLPNLCETLQDRQAREETRQRQQETYEERYAELGRSLGWAVIGLGLLHVACASSQTDAPASGIADCF